MPIGIHSRPDQKPEAGVVVDPSHPDSIGLIHCWLFNEQGSRILTDIVDGRSLVMNGTAAWANALNLTTANAAASPPWGGPYMNLEQTVNAAPAKYLQVPAANFHALDGTTEITVECICYMEDQSNWNVVCGNRTVDSSGGQFLLHVSDNVNTLGFDVTGTGGVASCVAGNFPLRKWTAFHGTYNSKKTSTASHVYINGVYVSTGATGGGQGALAVSTNPFNVGGDGANQRSFGGYVDRILIWKRELSQAEINHRLAAPYDFLTYGFDDSFMSLSTPTVPSTFPAGYNVPTLSQYQQLLAR